MKIFLKYIQACVCVNIHSAITYYVNKKQKLLFWMRLINHLKALISAHLTTACD